jgi:hypothetical protein
MIPNKQIGWSEKANLLWEISRQLDRTLAFMCTGPCPTTTTTTLPPTQLRMLFTDINNVVLDPTQLNEWNSFFQLPTLGNPFTSLTLIGNEIFLFGGSNITIVEDLFNSNTNILEIEDVTSNVIIATTGKDFSDATSLTTVILPAILTINGNCFQLCYSLTTFNISSCTNLGETVGNDDVFYGINNNIITLTVPLALMTCNAGNPDGDIQYLQANNTVTIITV